MRAACVLLAALALALLGCSADGNSATTTGKRKPLKVQHAMGETRVPFRAARPATLEPSALETALAIGVRPVASATPSGRFPAYLRARVRGVENLGEARDPDARRLPLLDPDVVIGNELYDAQRRLYARLAEEVPTVMSGIPISEWKADVRFFGEALGRGDDAERLLNDYDRRAARARRTVRSEGLTTRRALDALPAPLARELSPDFLASVFRDVGLAAPATAGGGRAGGLLAARDVLDALSRPRR